MNQTDILAIVETINIQWMTLFLKAIIAGVLFLILKAVIESFAFYLMFVFNKHLSVGTLVSVEGIESRIKNISLFTILLEQKRGFVSIPIRDWRKVRWLVLKDVSASKRLKEFSHLDDERKKEL